MNRKHTWTLILIVGLLVIAWSFIPSDPGTTEVEIAKLRRQASSVAPSATQENGNHPTTLVAAGPIVDRIDGYVGSQSCQECHQDQHQSWHLSYHRTMTQEVTTATAPAALSDGIVKVQGKTYKFSREQDDIFVELEDPIDNGELRKRRLVLMTGSHHAHVFWYESGLDKTPAQLQIMYIIDQQRWVPRRSFFMRPPNMEKENELGRWNAICSNCHTTHPRPRPDSTQHTWDTRVGDFGISCEACHGPGEAHVAHHRRNPDGTNHADDPIVNPRDLPPSTRSDLCGQCHGMMMVSFDNAADQELFYNHGRRFRPGDDLENAHFLRVVRASEAHRESETFREFDSHPGAMIGHFWPDGEMRVTGRDYTSMIESKCFQAGELSCLSCHTMHQQDTSLQSEWKDDQLIANMRGDAACLQCHPKYEELGTEHTHHPIDSHGSRCMNCHMPHTIYGILKTSRSHTISSPSVAKTLQTGRPNACSMCHLDHTLEETATHLADWYGQEKPELSEDEKNTAASLLHFLTGDAAQRVLQVNAFQWRPAQEASGTDWMRLFVLLGMEDPYDAIRLISERAYKSLPNAPTIEYDFLDSPQQRAPVFGREYQSILSEQRKPDSALLIDSDGFFDRSRLEALMNQRNHRPVYLQE